MGIIESSHIYRARCWCDTVVLPCPRQYYNGFQLLLLHLRAPIKKNKK